MPKVILFQPFLSSPYIFSFFSDIHIEPCNSYKGGDSMVIKPIQATTAWTDTGKDADSKDKTIQAKSKFSTMLRQLETGGAITDTGEKPSEDTTTVTRVMSDGSMLITVYEKDKIVAQTKTHSPHPEEIPTILSTRVEHSLPDDPDEQQNTGMVDAQMLNLLMQKQ